MIYTCSDCNQPVDVVGDGLAVMHEAPMRIVPYGESSVTYAPEEWCLGSGKPTDCRK